MTRRYHESSLNVFKFSHVEEFYLVWIGKRRVERRPNLLRQVPIPIITEDCLKSAKDKGGLKIEEDPSKEGLSSLGQGIRHTRSEKRSLHVSS